MTLQEYFLQVKQTASYWHAEKNGALTPADVTIGSHKKVWWYCTAGHVWQAPVYNIAISGSGCPYCSGLKAIPGETDLATQFPQTAEYWDPVRNAPLTPRDVLPGSKTKVWWQCELGHSWQAAPFARTRENGSGCPYCTGKKVLTGFNDLQTLRPGLAEEWHQPLNGDLQPTDVSVGSNKKVWWRCARHHVWQAAIYARTRKKGSGCPVCAGVAKARKIQYFEDRPNNKRTEQQMQELQQEAV